jgi:PKD repeat protein
MKKIFLALISGIFSLNCISQIIEFTENTLPNDDIKKFSSLDITGRKWFIQFVVSVEADGVSINNGGILKIDGLLNLTTYRIKLEEINTPGIYLVDDHLTVNNHIATYPITFNGTNKSTVYKIIITESGNAVNFTGTISGTNYPVEYYIVTERSKTGIFSNSPTNFKYKINWVDYWLNKHTAPLFTRTPAQFISDTEDALMFSWQKQIIDWGLCEGLTNNELIDDTQLNPEFDLNIDSWNQDGFPYRGCRSSNAMSSKDYRNISIDYNIFKMGQIFPKYSNEKILLYSAISHEFFHNIQYSFVQANYIPKNEMQWLYEGQCVLMQTLIMNEYGNLNNLPNEEFLIDRYYYSMTNNMLGYILNDQVYSLPPSMPTYPIGDGLYLTNISHDANPYEWSVLWRYLFDTYFQNDGNLPPTKTGLKIIMESVKHATNLSTIQADMDNLLATSNGTHSTFIGLLGNFAEDLYFCNNKQISGFIDDSPNFYANLNNRITTFTYKFKNLITSGAALGNKHYEFGFDGQMLNYNEYASSNAAPSYFASTLLANLVIDLVHPFQIQSREIFINNPVNGIRLTINNDINGDGNNTHVRAYIVDNAGAISYSQNIDLTGQVSNNISFHVVGANSKLVLLFLRTDQPPAGQTKTGDIEIGFAGACPGTDAVFSANYETIDAGQSVLFTNQGCSNITSWHWTFEGGTPREYDGPNPPYIEYQNPGIFNASLTVSDGISNGVTSSKVINVKQTDAYEADIDFIYNIQTGEFIGKSSASNIYAWHWKFSNGEKPGQIVKHQLPVNETMSFVTLTISFLDGSSISKTQRLIDCGYPY